MQFEIIGADPKNYVVMGFDEERDFSKGVFFYKIPISFFSNYVYSEETIIEFLIDIELFIEDMYDSLIRDGVLTVIDEIDFENIIISYGDGLDEIMD